MLAAAAVPEHIPNVTVDGRTLWTAMMAETTRVDDKVFRAIRRLKGEKVCARKKRKATKGTEEKMTSKIASGKYKVAALTNNSETEENADWKTPQELRHAFDYFIESKVVGLR